MNEWDVIARTIVALVAGGAIGLERSYHGRAAGLRTYGLVCFGSALLVAGAQYEFSASTHGTGEITRVIQGIVTGIGFLGAGVIIKDGYSVRGLTTSASIWVASAIGVVIGAGSYLTGIAGAAATLVALALFRKLEDRLPTQTFIHLEMGFHRAQALDEDAFRALVASHGFFIRDLAYALRESPPLVEYRTVIWTKDSERVGALEKHLLTRPDVVHFRLDPTRD
jgi:putative Mg2+ transporter-C (MgtC) family protein